MQIKIPGAIIVLGLALSGSAANAANPEPTQPTVNPTVNETTPTPPAQTAPPTEQPAQADADDSGAANKCSAETVSGVYGLQMQGFRYQGRKLVPYTAVRTASFDGQGHTSGQGMANVNGRVMTYSIDGSYTVNEDCSVTIDAMQTFGQNGKAEPYKQFGVLVNGGDEIIVMQTNTTRAQFGRYEKY